MSSTYDTNAAGLAEFIWGAGAAAESMLLSAAPAWFSTLKLSILHSATWRFPDG